MATPTYDLLASTTLTSSASSVTFSSIDQTYGDLILVVDGFAASQSVNFLLAPNGDKINGSSVAAYGSGSSAASYTTSRIDVSFFGVSTTSVGLGVAQIMDYSATDKHTSFLSRVNETEAAGGSSSTSTGMIASRWASTAAITSLEIYSSTAYSYAAGSTFNLYGVAK